MIEIFKLVLRLAIWLAEYLGKKEHADALKNIANRARDDVMSGRVQPDPDDPYRRD